MAKFRRKNLLPPKGGGGVMARKVTVYANLDDPFCGEVINLLTSAGVRLQIHDVKKQPLNSYQVSNLVRHYDLERFLNPYSKPYKKNKLGKSLPSRQEVIELIAEDNELFRMPIVISGPKMSIGFDLQQIIEMLQIKPNGSKEGGGLESLTLARSRTAS